MKQSADMMNSDIKALLTLLLLKNGAGSNEIQTALRMAAASRAAQAEELADAVRAETLADAKAISTDVSRAAVTDELEATTAKEYAA
jgi:hypothetical protein